MIRALALVLAVFVLAACAPSGPGVRSGDAADADIARVEAMLAAEDFEAAAVAWEELAGERPEDRDRLLIRAAEAWLQAGNPDEAELALDRVDPEALTMDGRVRLDLARAELTMRRGDLANAGWLLASTADRLPESLVERHARLEALLRELEARPVRSAVAALAEAVAEPDFSPETALALLLEFPLDELEGVLYEVADQAELMPWMDLVISAREHLLDDAELGAALQRWEARWPEAPYSADAAREWIIAWRRSRPLPEHITVLLPAADSPLADPGRALREGLIAAWMALTPSRRPELAFRYIGDAPEDALAAWFDARESGTDFLIGPLQRAQAEALAGMPDAGIVPTLLLNIPEDAARLAETPGDVTALGLPPETEAELAAIHALATGHRRAVVLAQYSGWGERVAEAFVSTFRLGGGEILANRIYDPQLPDHSTLLKEVLEVDASERRIRALDNLLGTEDIPLESVEQRRTDVDVIFLGARPEDGRLMRPQLEFFDAGDVTTMATSYIVDGAPDPAEDRDLDGLTTPMPPWFLDYTRPGQIRERARSLFPALDNATLSRLHALGRDTMALLPWLGMMQADPALELPGMVGTLSLPGPVVRRDLPVVEIRDGIARPFVADDDPARAR
jgi:hypothetical protein